MEDIPIGTMTSERRKQGNLIDIVFLSKMDPHTSVSTEPNEKQDVFYKAVQETYI